MGWASGREKSHRSDAEAKGAFGPLVAVSETWGRRVVYGRRLGVLENATDIGVAAASNWLIGPTPRMSSMVRSMDEVE
jgi:hypothetical protein